MQRDRVLCYSVAAGSLDCARTGNSNSILSSSFKTSRARKGLPFRERNPESTSRVRRSSISWRAISGVSVRLATRFQIISFSAGVLALWCALAWGTVRLLAPRAQEVR